MLLRTQSNFNIKDLLQTLGWGDETVHAEQTELNNRVVSITAKVFPKITVETLEMRNDYRVSIIDIESSYNTSGYTSKEDYLAVRGFISRVAKESPDRRLIELHNTGFKHDVSESIERNIDDLFINDILFDLAYFRACCLFSKKERA